MQQGKDAGADASRKVLPQARARAVSYGGNAMGVQTPTALPTLPLPPSPKQPARSAGTTEGWG